MVIFNSYVKLPESICSKPLANISWYVMDCHGICLQNDLNDLKLEGIFEGIEYAQMTPMDLCVFGVLATKSTRQRGRN
jgi:hypothetical protein